MSTLSSAQIKKYNAEGFIAPIDVFSTQEADEIKKEIEFIEKKWPNELEGIGRNYIHCSPSN